MPFYPKKSFKGKSMLKSRGAKRSAPRPKTAPLTKKITEVVRTIEKRDMETKFRVDGLHNIAGSSLASFTGFTSGITGVNEIYACIPRIAVGSDDFQRIGNVIQPTSLKVKGCVSLNTRYIASAFVDVDIYFCTHKAIKSVYDTTAIDVNKLLNSGNGANVAYNGTQYVSRYPVNTSAFTLIKKHTYRLFKTNDDQNCVGSGATNPTGGAGLDTYYAHFVQDIPLPQKLTYGQSTNIQPSNYFPFMMVGWHFPDRYGDSPGANTDLIWVEAQAQMYYKDA